MTEQQLTKNSAGIILVNGMGEHCAMTIAQLDEECIEMGYGEYTGGSIAPDGVGIVYDLDEYRQVYGDEEASIMKEEAIQLNISL